MKKSSIALAILSILLLQTSVRSEPDTTREKSPARTPVFVQPIKCKLGSDCFVLNYTDRDPGPGEVDFACGRVTYDGHTGTDFAIPDERVMAQGVPVLAAADGKVLRVRDGVVDRPSQRNDPRVEGKECGNGMVLDHGQGWETQYCHLRQNSVAVKPGTTVKAGTVLGLIGESGAASFPHVHFEVRYNGKPVDPFLGPDAKTGCNVPAKSMWQRNLAYVPTGTMNAGFTDRVPTLEDAEQGTISKTSLPSTSPALIFWVRTYGILKGDVEQIRVTAPDSSVPNNVTKTLERPSRIWLSYVGKRKPADRALMSGTWQGQYKLTRNNKVLVNITREVRVN